MTSTSRDQTPPPTDPLSRAATAAATTALITGPLVFLAAEAVTASAWSTPGYSYLHNWISDLGVPDPGQFQGRLINSPMSWLMNTGFVLGGVALLIGVIAVAPSLPGTPRRAARILATATAVGYVLVGLTHTSGAAAANGTIVAHFTGAFLAILGGNVLALVLGTSWWRRPDTRRLGHAVAPLGALGLVAVTVLAFTAADATAPNGLLERVSVYTVVLFQLRTAIHLAWTRTGRGTRASTGH